MTRIKKTLSISICLLSVGALSAAAQGILVPDERRPRPPDAYVYPFAVESHRVKVRVKSQVATTTVRQVFENKGPRPLEGTYLFPLPEGTSITEFAMWMDGRRVEGELVDAKKARRIYEDIVRRQRDPGLLEHVGRDLFRARVFPIPPGGRVQIEVVYHELLTLDSGLVGYRYPLSSCPVGRKPTADFTIDVDIESSVPIKSLYSPTHDIDRRIDGKTASCSYEETVFEPKGDFLLYYTVSTNDVGMNLLTHRARGDDGHFMLLLSPGRLDRADKTIRKDVVFVIDRSGSMRGEKIEQARDALRFCLQSLNDGDRFNVVTFATDVHRLSSTLLPVSEQAIEEALEFVDDIQARGGTDINEALLGALDSPSSNRPRFLIFLTDGEPTVGETAVDRILDNVRRRNRGKIRLFVFGVGYEVNTRLLDKLAADNRGTVQYVKPDEDIEVKVSSFYAKVDQPVLSDLSIRWGGIDVADVFPRTLPDLFNGSQLVVVGRYDGGGSAVIRLTGRVGDEKKEFSYEADFARSTRRNAFIGPIWASRKIAFLIDEIRTNGTSRELVDEVVDLSMEYGIITPYTSYLILEEDDRGRVSRRFRDELRESPARPMAESSARGMAAQKGKEAFDLSAMVNEAKEQEVVGRPVTGGVRHIGGKTFYRSSGGWIDVAYKDNAKTVDIAFLSDEYFALLGKEPDLAKYFALGENLIVVHNGTAYKISA